jgi:hypothetical protein
MTVFLYSNLFLASEESGGADELLTWPACNGKFSMKLQDIPIGGRFEYDGKIFTKTGPLTASSDEGNGQTMIPRYANLCPLDLPTQEERQPGTQRRLEAAAVKKAFDEFYRKAAELLDAAALPALAEARQGCLDKLKLR